ncbi:hypothetical protein RRG08_042732 [Elysia crispata]|uniref:Uncharacterized protein n=1 Tax=Elysia crispata TaxID=231223 RepID=A0AAE0XQE3_9GAST|nr:hypothetical protein RRG08_042732 [Elysia crispata]
MCTDRISLLYSHSWERSRLDQTKTPSRLTRDLCLRPLLLLSLANSARSQTALIPTQKSRLLRGPGGEISQAGWFVEHQNNERGVGRMRFIASLGNSTAAENTPAAGSVESSTQSSAPTCPPPSDQPKNLIPCTQWSVSIQIEVDEEKEAVTCLITRNSPSG